MKTQGNADSVYGNDAWRLPIDATLCFRFAMLLTSRMPRALAATTPTWIPAFAGITTFGGMENERNGPHTRRCLEKPGGRCQSQAGIGEPPAMRVSPLRVPALAHPPLIRRWICRTNPSARRLGR